MSDRYLTPEQKKEIGILIDWYSWKHSWHLPKDHNGYVDWNGDVTLEKCREILNSYRSEAICLTGRFDIAVGAIETIQRNREELERMEASEAEEEEAHPNWNNMTEAEKDEAIRKAQF